MESEHGSERGPDEGRGLQERDTGCIRIALLLVLLRENGIGRHNLFGGFIGDWRVDCVQ